MACSSALAMVLPTLARLDSLDVVCSSHRRHGRPRIWQRGKHNAGSILVVFSFNICNISSTSRYTKNRGGNFHQPAHHVFA
jgi:hypothetical protein